MLAGLFNNEADLYVTIDADLQDDPEVIKEMVARAKKGCDIVYGVRDNRDSDSFFKKYTALGFYKLMRLLGIKTVYNHSEFRLMSRRAVEALRQFPERNLFVRAMVGSRQNGSRLVFLSDDYYGFQRGTVGVAGGYR